MTGKHIKVTTLAFVCILGISAAVLADSAATQPLSGQDSARNAARIVALAKGLRRVQGNDQTRAELAAYVTERFKTDPAFVQAVGCAGWRSLTDSMVDNLDNPTKQLWSRKLCATFVPTDTAIASLGDDQMQPLCEALALLDSPQVPRIMAVRVEKTTSWQSWPLDKKSELAVMLRRDGSKVALSQLTQHVMSTYLSDVGKIRALNGSALWSFGWNLCRELSDSERAALAERIVAAKGMTSYGTGELVLYLHVPTARAYWKQVFAKGDFCKKLPSTSGRYLALQCAELGVQVPPEVLNELDQSAKAEEARKPLASIDYAIMSFLWHFSGDDKKAAEWATKCYQRTVGSDERIASASTNALDNLATALFLSGQKGEGRDYLQFAKALVEVAKKGQFGNASHHLPRWENVCGAMLGTDQVRQIVQAALTDEKGLVHVELAKALTWSYRQAGKLAEWKKYLDGQVEASGGDAKAGWLMARGYAESANDVNRSPLAGKDYLDQAVTAAQSDQVRLQALGELAIGYAQIGKGDQANSLLDGVAEQFKQAGLERELCGLRSVCSEAALSVARDQTEGSIQQQEAGNAAHHAELERRLADARKRGDREDIGRYERLLGGKSK